MIETKRLIVLPFDEDDVDFLYTLNNDVMVNMYLSFDSYSREKCLDSINEWQKKYKDRDVYNVYKVFLKETSEKIGLVFLVPVHEDEAEIGYRFLPQYWHQGYAKESINELINEAFKNNKLSTIIAETHPENSHSIAFLKKLDFIETINSQHQGKIFYLDRK